MFVSRVSIDVLATQDIMFWFVEQMYIGWRSPRVDKIGKVKEKHRVLGHLAFIYSKNSTRYNVRLSSFAE